MNKKQYQVMLVVAITVGILSGIVVKYLSPKHLFPMSEPVGAQPTPQPVGVIQAEKFELIGKTGIRRALLELESQGEPALKLYDAHGNLRIALSLRPDGGPNLLLWDGQTAAPRFGLALLPNGSPSAELADRDGNLRVVFGLETSGEPILALFDQKGNLRTALGHTTSKEPAS